MLDTNNAAAPLVAARTWLAVPGRRKSLAITGGLAFAALSFGLADQPDSTTVVGFLLFAVAVVIFGIDALRRRPTATLPPTCPEPCCAGRDVQLTRRAVTESR